jgi:hypothetical protein
MAIVAPRFAGLRQFEMCLSGARLTEAGFDSDGNLIIDEPNDPQTVAAIQSALDVLKYPVAETRIYDIQTSSAVKKFKEDQALPIPVGLTQHDGVTGPGTSDRLNSIFTPSLEPTPTPSPTPPPPALQAWEALISFRPPTAVQRAVAARFNETKCIVHKLEESRGPINLDYYPIRIEALPIFGGRTMPPEELLETIRRGINQFVDNKPGCTFKPYNNAIDGPAWLPPFLPLPFVGTVVSIDMFADKGGLILNMDSGSVVLSEVDSNHWRFSTLWTPEDHGHPVSGNREFGFVSANAGEWVFYTRGVDRTTSWLDDKFSGTVFSAAHRLWQSFQKRVTTFVNGNGGRASVEPATAALHDWPSVQRDYHHFSVDWAP